MELSPRQKQLKDYLSTNKNTNVLIDTKTLEELINDLEHVYDIIRELQELFKPKL